MYIYLNFLFEPKFKIFEFICSKVSMSSKNMRSLSLLKIKLFYELEIFYKAHKKHIQRKNNIQNTKIKFHNIHIFPNYLYDYALYLSHVCICYNYF